ncbi:DUF3887 domain-containing protein [Micromonospora sp. NPDC048999]|uniref:DUF3887 domain-containing protein n=1 Tax=Micromonospora sp. NPDC048999 TaxID=3155391 RepID=UPI0033F88190
MITMTEAALLCVACGQTLPPPETRGRRRKYCDATCRSAARRRRAREEDVNSALTTSGREDKIGAVRDSGQLAAVGEALVALRSAEAGLRDAVDAARDAGSTWSEIGDVLGTTRQAAFQRFGRPVDPRTGEPMKSAILPGSAEKAIAVFVGLACGDWEAVRADFDTRVAQALPDADAVAATWAALAGRYGRYEQQMGEPFTYQLGDFTVVDIPLRFEAGEQIGRVSFNPDGTVAGLFVLPPEAA